MSFRSNEAAIDAIVASCNGDLRGAVRALLLVNEHLEAELAQLSHLRVLAFHVLKSFVALIKDTAFELRPSYSVPAQKISKSVFAPMRHAADNFVDAEVILFLN